MNRFSKSISALLGCVTVMLGAPAQADDSEVFTNTSFLSTGIRPNVLFIIDTSGSMDTQVNVFNPGKTYTGACDPNKIYWRTEDTKEPPDCKTTTQWVSINNNRCYTGAKGMAKSGWWRGRTQMLIRKDNKGKDVDPTYWGDAVAGTDSSLECQGDNNVHGDLPGTTAPGGEPKYARNGSGTSDSNRWGKSNAGSLIDWTTRQRLSLYSGNYANWYGTTDAGDTQSRLETVRDVAENLIDSLDGVNLGLMRYSTTAEGGMVTYPISELTAANRKAMKDELDTYVPDGYTPLSETMHEAYEYLAGKGVVYGNTSRANGVLRPSALGSRVSGSPNTYDSPMDFSCQTTYIVYLTDGLPTQDNSSDTAIQSLTGKTCPKTIDDPDPSFPDSGRCLETLTNYMNKTDLRPDVVGDQKVVTYFIGFGDDVASSATFLNKVAIAGGTGHAYTQTDSAGLTATLEEIFGQVQDEADTTFVAPAVSVNAFNRSQNLNELFVSVFAPSKTMHWAGNLKKYRIFKSDIYGVDSSTPAVDDTGFFAKGSQALNSAGIQDGPQASKGGAAGSLPLADARKMYTYLGTDTDLTASVNSFKDDNPAVTAAMINAVDATERTRVINYTRGLDLYDENKDGSTTDSHHRMGDPMHARPAILIHGGTESAPQGTVFVPTNDGVLHAFDMNTSPTTPGDPTVPATVTETNERWSFIPQEFLARQGLLYDDGATVNRDYALDGDVKVFKYDVNQNGVIDAADGDKAYLFFGTGRGGSAYYSIDVTNINKPVFRWKISNTDTGFSKLGKTWSAPQIARVLVGSGSTQNAQRFVLLFGGGYDTSNDNEPSPFTYAASDSVGSAIYMVDLETGALLWRAASSGAGVNFINSKMTHSFPGNLTVLDTDGDKFADRIYAADMGGQVWRFDIWNGNPVSTLVAGGVLASLGNKAVATPSAANNRKFYYAPDVSPIAARGTVPYMNLALGSGYRGHPLSKNTQDRFYSIRDYAAYRKMDQATFNAIVAIKDTDTNLVDVTASANTIVDNTKVGWKLNLNAPDWRGEKVLAESTTASGIIFFPTFTPLAADAANPCLSRSLNRVYAVTVANAAPFVHWTDGATGPLTTADRFSDLAQKGIAPAISILTNPDNPGGMGICQSGGKVLNRCVKFGSAVRSYWEHK